MTQEVIHLTNTLPEAQTRAWLKLAERKNALAESLGKRELELQGLLLNLADDKLGEAMKSYKAKFTEMKDERLTFTNAIDSGIVQPLMAFEKRCDPKVNAEYVAVEKLELGIRQAATNKLLIDQAIATETGNFKAHFQNEYARIVSDLRLKYARVISETYQHCLLAKTPADSVNSAIQVGITTMNEIKPLEPAKFTRTHLTPEAAKVAFDTIPKPDYAQYLRDAINEINEKFSLYTNDLANAEQAAQAEANTFSAIVVEEVQQVNQQTAANTLIAQAEAFVMPEPGFKSVVETSRIRVEDDSQKWVLLITTAFIANFQSAFGKLRVKKYSALTVAQMAAALDAAGIKVEGVTYENIAK